MLLCLATGKWAWGRDLGVRPSGFSEPLQNDDVAELVDEFRFRDLAAIQEAALTSASISRQPWSGSYWPIYLGGVADRYADPFFPGSSDWKTNSDYILAHLGSSPVELLSPAEKYDLLVGDANFTLTRAMLAQGAKYDSTTGHVESWMGICHGWSPASFMMDRPLHEVSVLAADGRTQIPFFPADVKALASLLWANANYRERMVGGRCNEERPSKDSLGRPRDPDCLDTNPATWHLALVNQIGVSKRSFIMDMASAYEVWNQPLEWYAYSYYNPKTRQTTQSLDDARVALLNFSEDPLKPVRSTRATHLVGISMNVGYTQETWPNSSVTDDPSQDSRGSTHYDYDLELDASGAVVGGE